MGELQRRQNLRNDLAGPRFNRDDDRTFVRSWLLQCLELTVQQISWHEVFVAGGDAARDQRLVALEIDKTDVSAIADKDVTVAAFER